MGSFMARIKSAVDLRLIAPASEQGGRQCEERHMMCEWEVCVWLCVFLVCVCVCMRASN